MNETCAKCGGPMEEGTAKTITASSPRSANVTNLYFIVPGARTSPNPVKAFMQGLADEPTNRHLRIRAVRCTKCGLVELYAN